ncbi:hypothetical protein ISF_03467 [Cordyceps fumosorosea ARSEF 2679]|uniref:Rhodopsin domain-containing protein n=1 Tax=Cordyceps fumosorosea (strain ARSEF 2679) TaxID=1081104 RepID=A0A162JHK2_CORFA|nr:hypothetical protein ISF_03467 [Cordyceps fumosorosea ARSEF 2679]OAA69092.1 hypothetical protein ISF_03467 [Cordyceps fumosorosea ARSEF 2679]
MTTGNRGLGFPTDQYDDNGWKLYITSLVMLISAGIFVILRCSTRLWFRKFGWDDATIVASLSCSVLLSVAIQLAISHGYGMHKADLSKDELHMALKYFFIAQTPYKVTVCLNKVATVLLYLRLFPSPRFRAAAFATLAIIIAASIGSICATIFQCVPVAGAWNHSIEARCINSGQFWVAYAVMNILTDVMVLLLPIPVIKNLSLGRRDKAMLYGLFLLGGFVTITSILRTTSVQYSLTNRADITFNFIPRGIWTLIEANLGIIIPCLVILRQPLGILLPRLFGPSSPHAHAAFRKPRGDMEKGFALSDLSTSQADGGGLWCGSNLAQQSVVISGPGTPAGRRSEEQHPPHFFFDVSRDSDSEADGKTPAVMRGISKTVEVVRTSVHQDRAYYHTGGFSSPSQASGPSYSSK